MMAEHSFQNVMKQWRRMCESYRRQPTGCKGCPLVHESCFNALPYSFSPNVESAVMQWAEENPEKVYPTFREWLIDIGIIDNMSTHSVIADKLAVTPIPDKYAEKLELKPAPIVHGDCGVISAEEV